MVNIHEAFLTRERIDDSQSSQASDASMEYSAPAEVTPSTPPLVLNMVLERFGHPLSACLKTTLPHLRTTQQATYTELCVQLTKQFLLGLTAVHSMRVAHRVSSGYRGCT